MMHEAKCAKAMPYLLRGNLNVNADVNFVVMMPPLNSGVSKIVYLPRTIDTQIPISRNNSRMTLTSINNICWTKKLVMCVPRRIGKPRRRPNLRWNHDIKSW